MKIRPEQEKKWEAMWKKWEKPLPQNSSDDIFDDMEAAVPNWKNTVHDELYGKIGAVNSADFENAIETVLDGEDPKSKKRFWDNCITFDRFLDTVRYVVENGLHKFSESEETLDEASFNFDKYDWKDGSITGKGLIALISDTDKYSYNNAIKIYDRKSGKFYDIIDDKIDYKNSGLILDIDTSKESSGKSVLNKNESDSMKDNKEVNEELDDLNKEYVSLTDMIDEIHDAYPNDKNSGMHSEIFAMLNGKLERMTNVQFLNTKSYSDSGIFVLTDGSSASNTAVNKLSKQLGLDETEVNEADDQEPLSHALDVVDVKASTANSKAQDEVFMSVRDNDTYAGIAAAIDRDIDVAMEEIYR